MGHLIASSSGPLKKQGIGALRCSEAVIKLFLPTHLDLE